MQLASLTGGSTYWSRDQFSHTNCKKYFSRVAQSIFNLIDDIQRFGKTSNSNTNQKLTNITSLNKDQRESFIFNLIMLKQVDKQIVE